jgi:FkbM family methyltransferase
MTKNVEGLRVRCIRGALASAQGSFQVTDPGQGTWAYRTRRTESGADTVPAVTIPDLFRTACGTGTLFPFIVKIDIEGGEHDVFSAATEWLAATPVLFLEPHDWLSPGTRIMQPVLRCLADADRDFVVFGENIVSISNQLPR